MGVDMGVSMTGGPLGVPVLVPGPVLGRKGSWSLNALFGLQDSHGIPLPCQTALGHPHVLTEQRLSWCQGQPCRANIIVREKAGC